jgi:DMSO/TMAO reductase YedYZ molybdopterin-dependent catalytic subunit
MLIGATPITEKPRLVCQQVGTPDDVKLGLFPGRPSYYEDIYGFLAAALGSACTALLTGCDRLSNTQWFPKLLETGEHLNRGAQRLLTSRKSMAQEFTEADLCPEFPSNGTDYPQDPAYRALAANQFVDWALRVDGLVNRPSDFSLARLRDMRSRTQITRHDCVEGWSATGKWTGVPLSLPTLHPIKEARVYAASQAKLGAFANDDYLFPPMPCPPETG